MLDPADRGENKMVLVVLGHLLLLHYRCWVHQGVSLATFSSATVGWLLVLLHHSAYLTVPPAASSPWELAPPCLPAPLCQGYRPSRHQPIPLHPMSYRHVCIYEYVYTYIHMRIYIYSFIRTYTSTDIRTGMHTYIDTYM